MDQFMQGMHPFDRSMAMGAPAPEANRTSATNAPQSSLRSRFSVNRGSNSGLTDKSSKLASQDRLAMQARILGKSTINSLAAINVAFFTPIEFSFGKMTSMTMNAMEFCLNKFEDENKKKEKIDKNTKFKSLKRAEILAKKVGALIGFASMAILMGAVGTVAAGSAFSIYNSLKIQEDDE